MNLKHVDPNGAFVEAVEKLVVGIMDPEGTKAGLIIPWRTGPDGETGIPLRLVAEAAGRPVEEMETTLQEQEVMGEPALFTGRQGAKERLKVGAMPDETCVNMIALPFLIQRQTVEIGGRRCGKLIRIEAAAVAELLERLAGTKATA